MTISKISNNRKNHHLCSMRNAKFVLLLLLLFGFGNASYAGKFPKPDHVVIVVLENHSYNAIIGSKYDSFINFLADSGALFTRSFALTHPSEANYLMLFSGTNQGDTEVKAPKNIPFSTMNLGASLIAKGLTFGAYSENLPFCGYSGDSAWPYARRHCPWVFWQGIGKNQLDSTLSKPMDSFPSDFFRLPSVSFVIPNLDNDMHDSTDPYTIIRGDNWLKSHLGNYIQWAKSHNSLFILTFDEDDKSKNNQVATIFYGSMFKNDTFNEHISHYSVLRTIENMYGLAPIANDSLVQTISDCWLNYSNVGKIINDNTIDIYPIPVSNNLYINHGLKGRVRILNLQGKVILESEFMANQSIDVSLYPVGLYIMEIISAETIYRKKIIIER